MDQLHFEIWHSEMGICQSYWPTLSCRTTGKDLSSFEESQSICTVWQVVELVKTKVKAEFGSEVFGMLDALSECMEKISKDSKSLCWVNSCWAVCCWPRFSPLQGVETERSEVWPDDGASFGKKLNGLWDAMNSLKIYWCWFFGVWFSNLISGIAAASYHSPSITLGKFRLSMLFLGWCVTKKQAKMDAGFWASGYFATRHVYLVTSSIL